MTAPYAPKTARGRARVDQFTRLRETGLMVTEAARHMGICKRQAFRYEAARRAAGGPPIERVTPPDGPPFAVGHAARRERAVNRQRRYRWLRAQGFSPKAAARRVGVTARTGYLYEADHPGLPGRRRTISAVEGSVLAFMAGRPGEAFTAYRLASELGDRGAETMLSRHLRKLAEAGVVVMVDGSSDQRRRYSYRIARTYEAGAA